MDKGLKVGFFAACIVGSVFIAYTSNKIWTSASNTTEVSLIGNNGLKLDHSSYCTLKSEEFHLDLAALDIDNVFVLPRPKVFNYGNKSRGLITFTSKLTLGVTCLDCWAGLREPSADRIKLMVENYSSQMEPNFDLFCKDTISLKGIVPGIRIYEIDSVIIELQSYWANESSCFIGAYKLRIDHNSAIVRTCSEEGMRYALSTLSILMFNQMPFSLPISIEDWPDMEWRGMLIDVSRHFIPMRKLFRAIDAMSAVKMNVLHLHLTDSQVYMYSLLL